MPDPLALVASALVAWLYAIIVFAVRGDGRSGRAACRPRLLWATGTGRLRELPGGRRHPRPVTVS